MLTNPYDIHLELSDGTFIALDKVDGEFKRFPEAVRRGAFSLRPVLNTAGLMRSGFDTEALYLLCYASVYMLAVSDYPRHEDVSRFLDDTLFEAFEFTHYNHNCVPITHTDGRMEDDGDTIIEYSHLRKVFAYMKIREDTIEIETISGLHTLVLPDSLPVVAELTGQETRDLLIVLSAYVLLLCIPDYCYSVRKRKYTRMDKTTV